MTETGGDADLTRLLGSPQLEWRHRLIAHYYDKERKTVVIREVRAAIEADAHGLTADRIEALRCEVVRHLVGLASQAALRPDPQDELPFRRRSRSEIEELVIDQFPFPIAFCYWWLVNAKPGTGAFTALLDTFECLVRFLATVVLSVYWRQGVPDPKHNQRLLELFYREGWSTGHLICCARPPVFS